jgi:hypothetical protein
MVLLLWMMYVNTQSTGGFMGEGLAYMRTTGKRGIDGDPALWCAAEFVRGGGKGGGGEIILIRHKRHKDDVQSRKILGSHATELGCVCWSGCLRRKERMSLNFRRFCSLQGAFS